MLFSKIHRHLISDHLWVVAETLALLPQYLTKLEMK